MICTWRDGFLTPTVNYYYLFFLITITGVPKVGVKFKERAYLDFVLKLVLRSLNHRIKVEGIEKKLDFFVKLWINFFQYCLKSNLKL